MKILHANMCYFLATSLQFFVTDTKACKNVLKLRTHQEKNIPSFGNKTFLYTTYMYQLAAANVKNYVSNMSKRHQSSNIK
jgi:hypothetical protein